MSLSSSCIISVTYLQVVFVCTCKQARLCFPSPEVWQFFCQVKSIVEPHFIAQIFLVESFWNVHLFMDSPLWWLVKYLLVLWKFIPREDGFWSDLVTGHFRSYSIASDLGIGPQGSIYVEATCTISVGLPTISCSAQALWECGTLGLVHAWQYPLTISFLDHSHT